MQDGHKIFNAMVLDGGVQTYAPGNHKEGQFVNLDAGDKLVPADPQRPGDAAVLGGEMYVSVPVSALSSINLK